LAERRGKEGKGGERRRKEGKGGERKVRKVKER